MLLMRTYLMLYAGDRSTLSGMSRMGERQAFTHLALVCSYWHQTLIGWPHSPTPKWVRHQLKKLIKSEYSSQWEIQRGRVRDASPPHWHTAMFCPCKILPVTSLLNLLIGYRGVSIITNISYLFYLECIKAFGDWVPFGPPGKLTVLLQA